jgi:hypothetical protein
LCARIAQVQLCLKAVAAKHLMRSPKQAMQAHFPNTRHALSSHSTRCATGGADDSPADDTIALVAGLRAAFKGLHMQSAHQQGL